MSPNDQKYFDVKILEDFAKRLSKKDKIAQIKASEAPRKSVYAFFSIDLVNSTAYKYANPNWQKVFFEFYKIATDIVIKALGDVNSRAWKYIGDEVLFYIEVNHIDKIYDLPKTLYKCMGEIEDKLYAHYKGKGQNRLYMKTALWIAAFGEADASNDGSPCSHRNVMLELPETGYDFIGVDMDEGFRMSKYTSVRKMVVDPRIALMAHSKSKEENYFYFNDKLRIVDLVDLKGIWDDRYFPIIWYSDHWGDDDLLYLYDEHKTNEIVGSIRKDANKVLPLNSIEKIFKEQHFLEESFQDVEDALKNEGNKIKCERMLPIDTVKLYCSVVCIYENKNENKEVFLLMRANGEDVKPKLWEFGSIEAKNDEMLAQVIQKGYMDNYGLDISLICDDNGRPKPVSIFEFEKINKVHKGIIFAAKINNSKDEVKIKRISKYSSHKFATGDEVSKMPPTDAVPHLASDVMSALELMSK